MTFKLYFLLLALLVAIICLIIDSDLSKESSSNFKKMVNKRSGIAYNFVLTCMIIWFPFFVITGIHIIKSPIHKKNMPNLWGYNPMDIMVVNGVILIILAISHTFLIYKFYNQK